MHAKLGAGKKLVMKKHCARDFQRLKPRRMVFSLRPSPAGVLRLRSSPEKKKNRGRLCLAKQISTSASFFRLPGASAYREIPKIRPGDAEEEPASCDQKALLVSCLLVLISGSSLPRSLLPQFLPFCSPAPQLLSVPLLRSNCCPNSFLYILSPWSLLRTG